jgi:hypothetical protein
MSRLVVVNRTSTSLHVTANTVVVAGTVGVEVVQTVKGDSVFRGVVADSSSVTSDVATTDIVGGFGTKQETVTSENGVGSESRALFTKKIRTYSRT